MVDGDTLRVEIQGKEEKVRLIGIDSSECRENPKAEKEAQRTGQDIKKIIKMSMRATALRR